MSLQLARCKNCGSTENPWNAPAFALHAGIPCRFDKGQPLSGQCSVCGHQRSHHGKRNKTHRHHHQSHHHYQSHRHHSRHHHGHNNKHQRQKTYKNNNNNSMKTIKNMTNINELKQNQVCNQMNKRSVILSYYHGRNEYIFDVDPNIFDSGAFKNAYRGTLINQKRTHSSSPNIHNKTEVVIKKKKNGSIMNRNGWNTDLYELKKLKDYVNEWNALNKVDKTYYVSTAHVLKVKNGGAIFKQNEYLMIEAFLPEFCKWNLPLQALRGARSFSIQSFCHFTYHQSNGKELVNDSQGYRDGNKYILTDPYYLKGNDEAIIVWFKDHECNEYCDTNWRIPQNIHRKKLRHSKPYGKFNNNHIKQTNLAQNGHNRYNNKRHTVPSTVMHHENVGNNDWNGMNDVNHVNHVSNQLNDVSVITDTDISDHQIRNMLPGTTEEFDAMVDDWINGN